MQIIWLAFGLPKLPAWWVHKWLSAEHFVLCVFIVFHRLNLNLLSSEGDSKSIMYGLFWNIMCILRRLRQKSYAPVSGTRNFENFSTFVLWAVGKNCVSLDLWKWPYKTFRHLQMTTPHWDASSGSVCALARRLIAQQGNRPLYRSENLKTVKAVFNEFHNVQSPLALHNP